MNLDTLSKWLMLVANIGVIAGIIFLALELQQNNKFLQSAAVSALLETRMIQNEHVYTTPELAAIIAKNRRNEILTDEEQIMLSALYSRAKMGWQRDYFLFQEGILTENYIRTNIPIIKESFSDQGSFSSLDHWATWQNFAPSGYIAFINNCVLADCEFLPE